MADQDIEDVNREILARRIERAGIKPPSPADSKLAERPAVDLSGLQSNDFRAGLPALSAEAVAEMVETYRAGYSRFALDPNGVEIIQGMEAKLAAALAADGVKLSPLSAEGRLRALRIAAAARGNGI